MGMTFQQFTRITYSCDFCNAVTLPQESSEPVYGFPPKDWRWFSSGGRYASSVLFCPGCSAKPLSGFPFTIAEAIDAQEALYKMAAPKMKVA